MVCRTMWNSRGGRNTENDEGVRATIGVPFVGQTIADCPSCLTQDLYAVLMKKHL